jgi:hypothetical protein
MANSSSANWYESFQIDTMEGDVVSDFYKKYSSDYQMKDTKFFKLAAKSIHKIYRVWEYENKIEVVFGNGFRYFRWFTNPKNTQVHDVCDDMTAQYQIWYYDMVSKQGVIKYA